METYAKNLFAKIFDDLSECRIDIKNFGDKLNTFDISSENYSVLEPDWFKDDNGTGKIFLSNSTDINITLKIKGNGVLKLYFRGPDRKFDNNRIPLFINYKSIKINSEEILKETVTTWHDKPYIYSMDVKDGQVIILEVKRAYYNYSKNEIKDIFEKLYKSSNFIDEFLDYYIYNANLQQSKTPWSYVKETLLTQDAKCIDISEVTEKTEGKLSIKIGSTKFETFFVPDGPKKLFVALSAIGKSGEPYPLFRRVSWCDKLDGYYFCFDDPTRFERGFAPSYFFGTKEENYLEYVLKIIKKFTSIHKIPDENIVFISSSNGGFAALRLATMIPGSKAIALCPQVDTTKFKDNWFCKKVEVENQESKYFDRLQVLDILKNTKSHFFIYSNILCNLDRTQMEILYDKAGAKFETGLKKLSSNVMCLLTEIESPNPHIAQPPIDFVRTIEKTMTKPITKELVELYDSYLEEMKVIFAPQENN